MSRGMPSMTALLGLIAVAGYQNRDKLAAMLSGASGAQAAPTSGHSSAGSGSTDPIGRLATSLGATNVGTLISEGVRDLVGHFKQNGHADTAESWVGTGSNKQIAPQQLEQAVGPDVLATLSQQTGLTRDELLKRLSRDLPQAVDQYTPQGRIPDRA